jgi:uncharacterized membrane protein
MAALGCNFSSSGIIAKQVNTDLRCQFFSLSAAAWTQRPGLWVMSIATLVHTRRLLLGRQNISSANEG